MKVFKKGLDKWIIRKRTKKSTLNEAILELKQNKNMRRLNKKWIDESDQAYVHPISITEGSNVVKLILIAKKSKLHQDRISIKRYLLEEMNRPTFSNPSLETPLNSICRIWTYEDLVDTYESLKNHKFPPTWSIKNMMTLGELLLKGKT